MPNFLPFCSCLAVEWVNGCFVVSVKKVRKFADWRHCCCVILTHLLPAVGWVHFAVYIKHWWQLYSRAIPLTDPQQFITCACRRQPNEGIHLSCCGYLNYNCDFHTQRWRQRRQRRQRRRQYNTSKKPVPHHSVFSWFCLVVHSAHAFKTVTVASVWSAFITTQSTTVESTHLYIFPWIHRCIAQSWHFMGIEQLTLPHINK